MTPKRAEDLVYVHSLCSRNSSKYKEEETKLWDNARDDLSLNEMEFLKLPTYLLMNQN